MQIQFRRFFIFLWKPSLSLIRLSSLTGQNNPFELKKKITLIYSEKQFILLLGVSELKIHLESQCNSVFTGMLTFDLFSINWMQGDPVLGTILHPSAFDYRMCPFDCLFGRQRLLYWLTAWQSPTHLSCPNVILLPDMVCWMTTVNATVAFPVVHIYKVCHFTVNIL